LAFPLYSPVRPKIPIIVGSFFGNGELNDQILMSDPVSPPELIISLSIDKVGVHLLEQPEVGRMAWKSVFPVQGVFLEDQISHALDSALTLNPSLLDHFNDVAVVVIDRPNVCVPRFYASKDKLPDIASKYLKVRAGDTLASDPASGDIVIAYCMPTGTINMLREYYSNAGHMHLTSVLWNAIQHYVSPTDTGISRLFFFTTANTLIILGENIGKLSFSRSFLIQDEGDLAYYAIACSRMLKPKETWLLTLKEDVALYDMTGLPYFTFHHQRELPDLHTLIARHRSCES
jgi:hypothetical protein